MVAFTVDKIFNCVAIVGILSQTCSKLCNTNIMNVLITMPSNKKDYVRKFELKHLDRMYTYRPHTLVCALFCEFFGYSSYLVWGFGYCLSASNQVSLKWKAMQGLVKLCFLLLDGIKQLKALKRYWTFFFWMMNYKLVFFYLSKKP